MVGCAAYRPMQDSTVAAQQVSLGMPDESFSGAAGSLPDPYDQLAQHSPAQSVDVK